MYFPVGWPKHLDVPSVKAEAVQEVLASRDRSLFAVVTSQSIHIWQCKPCVLVVTYRRSDDSLIVLGTNQCVQWRPDCSVLAVGTSGGHLLLFKVQHEGGQKLLTTKQTSSAHYRWDATEADTNAVPMLKIVYSYTLQIPGGINSLCCLKDDLLVATGNGLLMRVGWDGSTRNLMDLSIRAIPFSIDLQQSRESTLGDNTLSFKHAEYSIILGGLAVVLSDGRAAFLTSENSKFEPRAVHAVWAPDVSNACCVAINHKYRLIVYGLSNGQGVVFTVDEVTGALLLSHRLTLSSSDFPDGCQAAGPVSLVKWTPDGCALACAWRQGGLALWSVFGALLMCTFSGDYGLCPDTSRPYPLHVQSMDWDPEGYNLWLTTVPQSSKDKRASATRVPFPSVIQQPDQLAGEVLVVAFVKSALTSNPCMTNHEHLFLQGEDRLYLNTGDTILKTGQSDVPLDHSPVTPTSQGNASGGDAQGPSVLIGNKQWQVLSLPYSYMASNWPLRYAAVDRSGHCVAIAGRFGLAHCTLFAKRWKLFGNITQERDMSVSGGVTWWRDFLVLSCYNHYENRHELRLYPRVSNLDNSFAYITKVPYQVLVLNVFKDILIVFCVDYHISLYSIERRENTGSPSASISRIQDLSLANFVPHPTSLVSLTLTSLRSETVSPELANHTKEAESLIINVAGRLLMLQRDHFKTPTLTHAPLDRRKHNEMPFCAPVVLASSVENIWTTSRSNRDKPHLMEALWLGCGAAGMKVWLPLFPQNNTKHHHSFLSKRIMLPFQLRIYPLAVLFEDAVMLGAATDTLSCEPQTPCSADNNKPTILPFTTVERTTQIYLHHILRQLLRRNLGMHALQIASSCTSLPYFPHVLELMLHSVLEEEATASEPIPDALLPRVVAFIEEFPQFLQTIVHCARKTEIALWPYLFGTIGSPQELFEQCIKTGALQTAASYLLILQNLEPPKVSRHHATQLLDAALEHCEWKLCRDLLRFLRSISATDFDVARTPPPNLNNSIVFPLGSPTPLPAKEGVASLKRGRHSSKGGRGTEKQEVVPEKSRLSSQSKPSSSQSKTTDQSSSVEEYFVDVILNRHARKLLTSLRLRDLGMFAAYLDFKLQAWLAKERGRVAKVEDFEAALKQLHHDFHWPLPTLTSGSASIAINATKTPSLLVKSSPPTAATMQAQINGLKLTGDPDTDKPHQVLPAHPRDLRILIRPHSLTSDSTHSEVRTEEAMLKYPSAKGSDDNSIGTTEPSEGSSMFGEGENPLEDSIWSSSANLEELEQFYLQLSQSGPRQSDKELRYLFDIFLAALCLEWALLIAIILRDLALISKVVMVTTSSDIALDVVARMREGLSFLELWADSECPGYKPLLLAIRPQAQVLAEAVEKAVTPPHTPHSRTSSTSDQSVGHQEIRWLASHGSGVISEHELSEEDVFEEEKAKDEENGCTIS